MNSICEYGCGKLALYKLKKMNDFKSNKVHEQYRIKHFEDNGYKCLIIWEHELKNIDKVKEKILNFDKEINEIF